MIAEILHKVAGFEKKPSIYYPRPSLAGPERCKRQLTYMAMGIPPEEVEDRFVMVLDDSSWHEELTCDWIQKSAFKLHSRQMLVECGEVIHEGRPYIIRGHIDGIITDLAGKDYLFEHKAINHFTFERYCQGVFPLDYLTQCVLYMQGLKKIEPGIEQGILLIKNKNTSAYLEFFFSYDAENDILLVHEIIESSGNRRNGDVFLNLYSSSLKRFNEIEEHRKKGTLPERQYSPGDWQCRYCPYGRICWDEDDSKIAEDTVVLSEQEAEKVKQYYKISSEIREIQKIKDELSKEIREIMKCKKAVNALAGDLVVKVSLQKKEILDKSLIPEEILKSVVRETIVETLQVKQNKRR